MRKMLVISILFFGIIISISFTDSVNDESPENLRRIYSRSPTEWPRPFVDADVEWKELGILPDSPLQPQLDSLKHLVELGKILFFDPRLSGSAKISCATCHRPELSWTDGKERSIGHDGTINIRNSPSIQNVWVYKKLFWDGRARDLEDQAFAPINSESEMRGDMRQLPFNLRKIKGYSILFNSAFGDPGINPDRIAHAIALFEKTIVSRKSRFDEFLNGDKKKLTDKEILGLHVFRTKAGCMNCHHGPLFTDNLFHKTGLTAGDDGLYKVTHKEEDRQKFKTPVLRDVMQTGPWLHDGSGNSMRQIVELYRKGAPGADKLIKPFVLNAKELEGLLSFLKAISATPVEFKKPVLPE